MQETCAFLQREFQEEELVKARTVFSLLEDTPVETIVVPILRGGFFGDPVPFDCSQDPLMISSATAAADLFCVVESEATKWMGLTSYELVDVRGITSDFVLQGAREEARREDGELQVYLAELSGSVFRFTFFISCVCVLIATLERLLLCNSIAVVLEPVEAEDPPRHLIDALQFLHVERSDLSFDKGTLIGIVTKVDAEDFVVDIRTELKAECEGRMTDALPLLGRPSFALCSFEEYLSENNEVLRALCVLQNLPPHDGVPLGLKTEIDCIVSRFATDESVRLMPSCTVEEAIDVLKSVMQYQISAATDKEDDPVLLERRTSTGINTLNTVTKIRSMPSIKEAEEENDFSARLAFSSFEHIWQNGV